MNFVTYPKKQGKELTFAANEGHFSHNSKKK